MNRRLAKLLAALLIAALLTTNVALMEDAPTEDAVAEETVTVEEPAAAEVPVEEEAKPAEPVVAEEEAVEAVDELVAEQDEVELVETSAFEAQVEEELPVEEAQPAEEAPEIVEAEADEAAKLMEPAANEIPIDAAHFPDAAFRAYVARYDTDGNGKLTLEERENGYLFQLNNANVTSLQGIGYFPNASLLECSGCALGALDLSQNPNLEFLNCMSCSLNTLILGSQPKLSELKVSFNQLTALDVSQCPSLMHLEIWVNNIATLDISNCPSLVSVVNPTSLVSICNSTVNGDANSAYSGLYYSNGGTALGCDFTTVIVGGSPVQCIPIKSNGKSTYKTTVGSVFYLYMPKAGEQYSVVHAKSSKGKVVSGIGEGVWTANAKGTAKLTWKGWDGKTQKIATIKVVAAATPAVVTPPPENAITVTKNMKYWVNVGTFHQIYLNGKTGKSFKSSNKKVAYVDQSGNIAAVGGGKTKITFKVGKKKRTLTLIVVDPTLPTAVYLDKAGTVAAKVGETQTITAAVPDGAITEYTWKSSNKKVATVLNGVVTFKKKGKVTITCTTTRGKKKAKVTFKVSK